MRGTANPLLLGTGALVGSFGHISDGLGGDASSNSRVRLRETEMLCSSRGDLSNHKHVHCHGYLPKTPRKSCAYRVQVIHSADHQHQGPRTAPRTRTRCAVWTFKGNGSGCTSVPAGETRRARLAPQRMMLGMGKSCLRKSSVPNTCLLEKCCVLRHCGR